MAISAPLIGQRCVACRADSPHVTEEEIAQLHPQVPEWRLFEEDGTRKLERTFKVRTFMEALALTNAVGAEAEEEGHHPRLVTEWGRLTVTWWTHAIKDLHRNDFIMAARTDRAWERLQNEGS